MPNASNVAVTCFAQVVEAEKLDAVQVVLSDPHYWGGIRALRRFPTLRNASARGLDALE